MSKLYTWNNYRCSYAVHSASNAEVTSEVPLLLVHPIGVGLSGFWRQNYAEAIANITQPTLVVMGETASSISKTGKGETPDQRSCNYLKYLHAGEGIKIPGRNVLPYESTADFVSAIAPFVIAISS